MSSSSSHTHAPISRKELEKDKKFLEDFMSRLENEQDSFLSELDKWRGRELNEDDFTKATRILNKRKQIIVQLSIEADDDKFLKKNFGNSKTPPSEFSQLEATMAPRGMYTELKTGVKRAPSKRSRPVDILRDNFEHSMSVRGKSIYLLMDKDAFVSMPPDKMKDKPFPRIGFDLKKDTIPLSEILKGTKKNVQKLLDDITRQSHPSLRSGYDFPFWLANTIISRTLLPLEKVFLGIGTALSWPFHKALQNFQKEGWQNKAKWVLPLLVTGALHLVAQIPNVVGMVCRYTRHLAGAILTLPSSFMAKVTGSTGYGNTYPTLKACGRAIGKSLLYLIPAIAIVALCFVPGMQFIPALAAGIAAKFSLTTSIAALFGLGVGTAVTMQAVSGGIHKGVILTRDGKPKKALPPPPPAPLSTHSSTVAPPPPAPLPTHSSTGATLSSLSLGELKRDPGSSATTLATTSATTSATLGASTTVAPASSSSPLIRTETPGCWAGFCSLFSSGPRKVDLGTKTKPYKPKGFKLE